VSSAAVPLSLAPAEGRTPALSSAEDDEPALVERVRRGDTRAFDALVSRYMRRAFAVAWRLLGNREDAEDLVQEAFMTVLRKIDTFEPGRAFSPWFFRLLVNRGLNARKSRALRTTAELPEDAAAAGASPERAAERAELRGRLRTAMDGLPDRQRVIVELFELEGFAGGEIAEILEISDGTVRWHLHEARKTLRQVLAAYDRRDG
jgi:RNA polymerase sigma-70 factor (ECF subfamily)